MTIKRDSADVALIEGPVDAASSPPKPKMSFPQHSGPGFVEIKPHSAKQIRLGLAEVADRRKERPQDEAFLLTYTYRSELTPGKKTPDKSSFTGHLLKPKPELLKAFTELAEARDNLKKATKKTKKANEEEVEKKSRALEEKLRKPGSKAGATEWLDNLGLWWPLETHQVSEPSFWYWRRWGGHGAGGSMLEHQLRKKFVEAYKVPPKKHLTQFKAGSDHGEDILFTEIAEFLYELEAELDRAA